MRTAAGQSLCESVYNGASYNNRTEEQKPFTGYF